jgi:hypothetical protein
MSTVIEPQELSPAARQRLARLLGMLGSDHDGEVLNAARLADRLVRSAGATWHDVVRPPAMPAPTDDDPLRRFPSCVAACIFVLKRRDLLTEWERAFVPSVAECRRPSPKQNAVLRKLVLRAMAAGGV